MTKATEKCLLFQYIHSVYTPLSKPFKSKRLAEKTRRKYPEKERRAIGLGVVRMKGVAFESCAYAR
jgi:hypothetical protein